MQNRTLGVSPKVYVPVLAQVVAAVVLLILGEQQEAYTLLATAAGTAGLGGWAKPGNVVDASADRLADLRTDLHDRAAKPGDHAAGNPGEG
jgi:hypothetical protein